MNVRERMSRSYGNMEVTIVHRGGEKMIEDWGSGSPKFSLGFINQRWFHITLFPKDNTTNAPRVLDANLLLWAVNLPRGLLNLILDNSTTVSKQDLSASQES